MDKVKKYFWTTDDEYLNGENTFDTVEECLKEARYYWLNGDDRFSVQDPDLRADSVIVTVGETRPVDLILDSTTGHRFYSKSGSLEHDYEITRDWYKMIN